MSHERGQRTPGTPGKEAAFGASSSPSKKKSEYMTGVMPPGIIVYQAPEPIKAPEKNPSCKTVTEMPFSLTDGTVGKYSGEVTSGGRVKHGETEGEYDLPHGVGFFTVRFKLRFDGLWEHGIPKLGHLYVIDSKWSWVGEFDGKLDFIGWGIAMRPDGSVFKEGKWDGKGGCIGNSTGIRHYARAFVYAEVSNPALPQQAPYLYKKLSPEIPAANIIIKKEAPGYNADVERSVGLSPLFKHSKPDAHRSELDIAFDRPSNAIASPAAPAPSLRETFEWNLQPKGPASPSPFAQSQGSPFDMPKHKPSSAILQDPKNRGVAENMLTKQVWLRRTLPEEFFVLAEQMGKEL